MNIPILITGCQRSGTTLLNLILDSHPDVHGVDEGEFDKVPPNEFLSSPRYHPFVSWKLPGASHEIQSIKRIPGLKVLWCIRDPRDVVLSMINLKVRWDPTAVPWAAHPLGSWREIDNCFKALEHLLDGELLDYYKVFKGQCKTPPEKWGLEDSILAAALCWRVKHEVFKLYVENKISCKEISYERLIASPSDMILEILNYLGLPWHDNVLNHHLLHTGISVGKTENTRPIDPTNTRKWVNFFDSASLDLIRSICVETGQAHGYDLRDA